MLLLLLNVAFDFHLYNGQLHVQLYVHHLHVGVDSGLKERHRSIETNGEENKTRGKSAICGVS